MALLFPFISTRTCSCLNRWKLTNCPIRAWLTVMWQNRRLTHSRGRKYMVRSMFLTVTQQLTWDFADSIHTFPNRYTTPRPQLNQNIRMCFTNLHQITGLRYYRVSVLYIFTPSINMTYLAGCTGLQRHPTNRSGKPARRQPPPLAGVCWSQPVPLLAPHWLRPPPLVPKSFRSCWTWKRRTKML